jgi:hypothetical protein
VRSDNGRRRQDTDESFAPHQEPVCFQEKLLLSIIGVREVLILINDDHSGN